MKDTTIGRRTFLRASAGSAALAAGGALMAACGGTSADNRPGAAGAASNGIFGGTPKRGGHLNFATTSDINGFDPSVDAWDQTGTAYARAIFDPLGVYDANGKVQPYLAQSITPNADFSQWSVKLRPNIVFHDGAPLDASGVVTFADKMLASPLTGFAYSPVASVGVSDPLTVVFKLHQSWPTFASYLAEGQLAYPPSPNFWANPQRSRHPIGTGPFLFKEWLPGDHLTVTRNPHYWRPGLPYLDSVTFRPIADTTSAEDSLKAGQTDLLYGGSTDQIADLQSNPGFFYFDDSHPSARTYNPVVSFLLVNCAKPPLDDVRLRRALAFATDAEQLIKLTFNGIGTPINGPFPRTSEYYTADTGYPAHDLAKAKALVSEVMRDKGPVTIELGTVTNPKDVIITQAVAAMWQAAGINVRLATIEQTTFIQNALLGKFDVYTYLLFGGLDFDQQYVWLDENNARPIGQFALNFGRFKDDQLQAAINLGRTSSDQATRVAAYQTVAKRLGAGCPYIWITGVKAPTMSRKNVHNFAGGTLPDGGEIFRSGGVVRLAEVWMD
jgi:peptide/nickel transport system substrate-binding protein